MHEIKIHKHIFISVQNSVIKFRDCFHENKLKSTNKNSHQSLLMHV